MKPGIFMIILILSVFIYIDVSPDVSVRGSSDLLRVQMGENISLNCSMRNQYEVAWYHLRSEQLDLLTAAEKDDTGRKLLINYNQNKSRLKLTADTWVTRATLEISGVTESDSGLYFCGTKSDAPEMFFSKSIRLEIEGNRFQFFLFFSGGNVTTKERALMFGGVGLAIAVFFLATVIAGGIIHYRGWQKGWSAAKRSSLIQHKSAK
uniref:Ig-like domain-containing protein n=2 Tax=Cyprinus carpio TaxID=7962 RepID=A0A9J8CC23_CYPCA